jgi:hypothetical protein
MSMQMLASNVFQLYAVVVFIVLMLTTVLKPTKDILSKSIPKATIAYKLLLAVVCSLKIQLFFFAYQRLQDFTVFHKNEIIEN